LAQFRDRELAAEVRQIAPETGIVLDDGLTEFERELPQFAYDGAGQNDVWT
jgi:hypothetical protein